MLQLTKHKDERWYEARSITGKYVGGSRVWSLGNALELAVRHLSRPVEHHEQIVILECFGSHSGYSSVELLVLTRTNDEITIQQAGVKA